MTAEIIAVGTEILLGDIVNTNAQYIARALAGVGIASLRQTVVGDNEERLLEAIDSAYKQSDVIIATGGLGPTADDITKETFAKFFDLPLIEDAHSKELMESYFKGREIVPSNYKQIMMPKGCIVLDNHNGTAPACIIEKDGKIAVILPGPPKEMYPLFEDEVLPYFKRKQSTAIVSKELKLVGIGESSAAEIAGELLNGENPTVAPYAKEGEMLFRITARAEGEEECEKLIEPVKNILYERLGKYIYGEDKITLEAAVMRDIINKGLTVATAESCTGGMVAARLINYPGASEAFADGVVSYSNESKVKFLGVKKETLEKYGAVSEETAREMCLGVAAVSNTDIGLSTTGVAGPTGGTPEKPIGLVYIGVAIRGKAFVKRLELKGNRDKIRTTATAKVIQLLREKLKEEYNG